MLEIKGEKAMLDLLRLQGIGPTSPAPRRTPSSCAIAPGGRGLHGGVRVEPPRLPLEQAVRRVRPARVIERDGAVEEEPWRRQRRTDPQWRYRGGMCRPPQDW
jgi:hypothetical protein